jgi:hypothetical protein
MQDDCIMQFWNFLHLDKGKIWYGVNERKSFSVCHIDQHIENSWYSSTIGIEEVKKILPCLTPKEKEVLDDNFGKDSFGFYWCDFFYLPVRFSERAIQLCDQLSRVWCDLAVSTILGVSDHLKNWEKLPHSWTCFIQDNYLIEYYKPEFYWLHPIKYSSESNRNYVRSVFKEQFYDNLEEVSANE